MAMTPDSPEGQAACRELLGKLTDLIVEFARRNCGVAMIGVALLREYQLVVETALDREAAGRGQVDHLRKDAVDVVRRLADELEMYIPQPERSTGASPTIDDVEIKH